MSLSHGSAVRDTLANAINTAVGSGGKLVIKDGGAAVLVSLPMATPSAFGAASGGTITAGTIATTNATGAGTATTFEVQTSGGTKIYGGSVGVGTGDLQITNTNIAIGDPISITSLTYSAPT